MDTIQGIILDVTAIEPRRKHPVIFEHFDALEAGQQLIIHNDHDPKPLYYQLLGERGNIFTWNYIENGPEWWKVEIAKNHDTGKDETIAEISASDIRKIEVFKKYGIDFCCGGNRSLKDVCAEKGLDIIQVKNELEAKSETSEHALPYNTWKLDFLAEFIVQTHHSYVRKQLSEICAVSFKVCSVHSEAHPELVMINRLVNTLESELSAHLLKEEKVLFPYITQIQKRSEDPNYSPSTDFDSVQVPIQIMLMEHESAGEIIDEIKSLNKNYSLPDDACNTFSYFYTLLSDFEKDLKIHIHLENNILFPKAIEMEKQLLSTSN